MVWFKGGFPLDDTTFISMTADTALLYTKQEIDSESQTPVLL
jgi:hypothetical protein